MEENEQDEENVQDQYKTKQIDVSTTNFDKNCSANTEDPVMEDAVSSKTFKRSEYLLSERDFAESGGHSHKFINRTDKSKERRFNRVSYEESDRPTNHNTRSRYTLDEREQLTQKCTRSKSEYHQTLSGPRQWNVCKPKCYKNYRVNKFSYHRNRTAVAANVVTGLVTLKVLVGKEPEYIVTELTRSLSSLKILILGNANDREFIEVFLEVLSEAFMSKSTPNMLVSLFYSLKEANFFQHLVAYFVTNALVAINDEGELRDKRCEKALKHSLYVITKQITRNPSSISVFRGVHAVLSKVIENMKKDGTVDDDIDSMFYHFSEDIEATKAVCSSNAHERQPERKPTDDFKQYPVSPTADEILGTTKPFLRSNRISGKYEDLNDYLDVQFRLLREDFVGPLREGLAEYKDMVSTNKGERKQFNLCKHNLKVYENVKIITPVITQYGICYKLKLDMTPRMKKIKWQFSKHLIFGSLVCLMDNDFENILCATVVEREDKSIKDGFLVVKLERDNLADHRILHRAFVMVESSGYFEAYRHVLNSLQNIEEGYLPFEKYIVKCEQNVDPPRYLRESTTFDLRPLIDSDYKLDDVGRLAFKNNDDVGCFASFSPNSLPAKAVCLLDPDEWPSKESLHMDESQYRAVQTALTKEFAIIQGPPGTGKTYIGLQIVKALLHNKTAWTRFYRNKSPILIVCYTNHALDQFLEGIVKFYKRDVVRVGGRSNSEVLKNYNLKKYRQSYFSPLRKDEWKKLIRLIKNNLYFTKRMEIYKSEIISEDILKPEMGNILYDSLKQGSRRSFSWFPCICRWLDIHELQIKCSRLSMNDFQRMHRKPIEIEEDAIRWIRERERMMLIDFDELSELEKAEKQIQADIRYREVAFFVEESEMMNKANEPDAKYRKCLKAEIVEKITDPDTMTETEANNIQNIWDLDGATRWKLYRLWIKKLCSKLYNQFKENQYAIELACEHYQEALKQEEEDILSQASVIGMTTSCAAKYNKVLRHIAPKIIIVEEAAEVLEAHIVTSLSQGCEHLILIGDHKQLRPNPTVYKLAVKYNLDISLFERMIKNGIDYNCLNLQHRMRPEISSIMRNIYPDLQDHEHVKTYPSVKGVSANMFLVNHSQIEQSDEDSRSYSNPHEASYAVALCRYLILQGYENSKITVLTTYTGQLMCIRSLMPKTEFEGVKVTVVDNYQGEENEIIILSLVRSNSADTIGYLNIENRICVALSRAKVGFFLLGNFEHLSSHSDLWKKITEELKTKNAYGEGLKLYCQNHPVKVIIATTPEDFKEAPEGGCKELCDIRLICGHKCERYCHIIDKEHSQYQCKKSCTKVLCDLGHTCTEMCYIKCKPCKVPVKKTIPKCGHSQLVPCATEPERFKCLEPCQQILESGHPAKIPSDMTGKVNVPIPYITRLNCGHICKGTCGFCFPGKIHKPCTHECHRILICGHKCKDTCNNCPPCNARCKNWCVHRRCDRSCGEPCQPCTVPCPWKCEHHQCMARCSEPCSRPRCNKPCKKRLSCKHACIGLCGETCPKYCRVCNKQIVCNLTPLLGIKNITHARFVLLEDCEHIVEYQTMDRYMDVSTNKVELKCCPICNTPIRKCLRYGAKISQTLQDIEKVKLYLIGNNTDKYKSVEKLINNIDTNDNAADNVTRRGITSTIYNTEETRCKDPGHSYKNICKLKLQARLSMIMTNKLYTEREIHTIEMQHRLFLLIIDIILQLNSKSVNLEIQEKQRDTIDFLEEVLNSLLLARYAFSEQELEEYTFEILRGTLCVKYLKIHHAIQTAGTFDEAAAELEIIDQLLFSETKFTRDVQVETAMRIQRLSYHDADIGNGNNVEERLETVTADRQPMNQWLKCSNNHIYGVQEPSGSSEGKDCPECKAKTEEVQVGNIGNKET